MVAASKAEASGTVPAPARRGWLRSPRLRAIAGLSPVVLWQLIFFVLPMGMLSMYSFWRLIDYKIDKTPTLYNYYEIFNNPFLWKALVLSLEIAVAVTIACAILAYPIAYFIAKKAGRWRVILLIAVIIPFWTSLILRAYAWKLLLGNHGFINTGLMMSGALAEPISYLLYSPVATAIGLIYAFLPFYTLPIYTSVDKVQDSWLEAATDLGATPFRAFVEAHPANDLAGNAQYWLAETYYVRNDYETAAREFLEGYQRYPESPKAPDFLLKLGVTLSAMGQRAEACSTLEELSAKFPLVRDDTRRRSAEERAVLGCP